MKTLETGIDLPREASICVALSGGLDSVVLLDLLATHAERGDIRLSAVHVHHGLSPNADDWAAFCRGLCAARGIPLAVEAVRVDRAAREGLEAAARMARYAVFAARPEDFVALAHHRDDQVETVLLQLLRGAGLKGVAAMPAMRALAGSRVRIVRPLLAFSRSELAEHAGRRGLAWIEDESNATLHHDRNFVRLEVAPLLDARFPAWRETVARFAAHAAGAERLLAVLAQLDGVPLERGAALTLDASLDADRRRNALRAFLAVNDLPMPGEARLEEMACQLFGARGDARVRIEHAQVALVRHRDRLHLEARAATDVCWRVAWHGEPEVDLGASRGCVRFKRAQGEGIAASTVADASDWHFAPRAGGERIRIDPRRPTRTLKNLLQESAMPPWRRERLPLLFHGGRLVWVPGIGIAADHACAPGAPGLCPAWVENPPAAHRAVLE